MRVALFGSPLFALPTLERLRAQHELVLVVAQPDKPAGRGNRLTPPPVAVRARDLGLRLEQPARLKKNDAFFARVRDLNLDVAVTAAYGKLLPQALLDLPKHGFLNVHGSLLPKYRGAAPVQWALICGEAETGISIMQTEAGLDTGPVRLLKKTPIAPEDTALSLFERLATLGAKAVDEALELLARGALPSTPQNDAAATHAPLLVKDDGVMRWSDSAQQIFNRFRGVYVWPGTQTTHDGKALKVTQMTPLGGALRADPGAVLEVLAEGVTVQAGEGAVRLEMVQPAGKPKMTARDYANGYGVTLGTRFGDARG